MNFPGLEMKHNSLIYPGFPRTLVLKQNSIKTDEEEEFTLQNIMSKVTKTGTKVA